MQHLDLQVLDTALEWANDGETIWLCSVLATFGSSPREPGSMLVAKADGSHVGSLSGGCIEEDFLGRIAEGHFGDALSVVRYGEGADESPQVSLPCGGILDVLVERLTPDAATLTHLEVLHATLLGQRSLVRRIDLESGRKRFVEAGENGPRVERDGQIVQLRVGPALRLIIAGISPVSHFCAEFARALGFEVIVCDPREEARRDFRVEGVEVQAVLPSLFIGSGATHAATAIVALTHDPRIDDLAMIEAVRTSAFYIGVMGSKPTSEKRAERLKRSGGLDDEAISRIYMPIGLNLDSKTPAEIALAVVADILRVRRGKSRHEL
ncbi:XdhC family protein [Salinicola sp. MIT1003]|uniref:XdhC family protein n=1 Tax=Salinicola sp. MIT1003 TaxID=1882734 RepID=UPI0008DE09F7|nr:XdhC family protein [Salinicola sp. MIT1003]OHZ04908.1 XshC-Cox1 family protein [Salinicola sp. MIT1003]